MIIFIIFYSILSIIKNQLWLLSICTSSASWLILAMRHPGTGHFSRWRDDSDGPGSFKSFSIEYSIEQIRSFEHFFKQGGAKGWSRNPEVLGNDWKPRQEPAYVRRLIAACRHPPQRPTFFRFESQLSVFFPLLYFRSVFTCVPQQFLKYWGLTMRPFRWLTTTVGLRQGKINQWIWYIAKMKAKYLAWTKIMSSIAGSMEADSALSGFLVAIIEHTEHIFDSAPVGLETDYTQRSVGEVESQVFPNFLIIRERVFY